MPLSVTVLRELFRNLQQFRSLYQTEGVDEVKSPVDGEVYSLFDLEYLYTQLHRLPPRQRQAIELCLVQNKCEKDAAVMMGVSATNPVAMYATSGLEKLVALVQARVLPSFQEWDYGEVADG